MQRTLLKVFGSGVAMVFLGMGPTVHAQNKVGAVDPDNEPPPAGAILDLAGTPIPHSYQEYTVDFTASQPSTSISFAMREDPAFLLLDGVSVVDITEPGGNLILNGGFELGPVGASAPTDWTYLNSSGASYGGVVVQDVGLAHSGNNFYYDGAVQAYDAITQVIGTSTGDTYQISFWLNDDGPLTTFQDVSNNGDTSDTGGNGADLLVYAGAVPVPEPTTFTTVLFGLGLLSLGILRVSRLSSSAAS